MVSKNASNIKVLAELNRLSLHVNIQTKMFTFSRWLSLIDKKSYLYKVFQEKYLQADCRLINMHFLKSYGMGNLIQNIFKFIFEKFQRTVTKADTSFCRKEPQILICKNAFTAP